MTSLLPLPLPLENHLLGLPTFETSKPPLPPPTPLVKRAERLALSALVSSSEAPNLPPSLLLFDQHPSRIPLLTPAELLSSIGRREQNQVHPSPSTSNRTKRVRQSSTRLELPLGNRSELLLNNQEHQRKPLLHLLPANSDLLPPPPLSQLFLVFQTHHLHRRPRLPSSFPSSRATTLPPPPPPNLSPPLLHHLHRLTPQEKISSKNFSRTVQPQQQEGSPFPLPVPQLFPLPPPPPPRTISSNQVFLKKKINGIVEPLHERLEDLVPRTLSLRRRRIDRRLRLRVRRSNLLREGGLSR